MNFNENISRIKEIMGLITEEVSNDFVFLKFKRFSPIIDKYIDIILNEKMSPESFCLNYERPSGLKNAILTTLWDTMMDVHFEKIDFSKDNVHFLHNLLNDYVDSRHSEKIIDKWNSTCDDN